MVAAREQEQKHAERGQVAPGQTAAEDRPLVAASMFGVTTVTSDAPDA
jgi:hypothetical protein